ncbi:glycosyltransferase [Candidatus Woesearchaeota archaeon]|nr:glycosyltransferase [Candidatus Woesearchaeota archaeon]
MKKSNDIIIISPRQWDLQWGQEKDLINELNSSYSIVLLELIDYIDLHKVYPAPKNTRVVRRKTSTRPGLRLGLHTELRNLRDSFRYDFRILITYMTVGSFLTTLFARIRGKKVLLIYADDMPELHRGISYIGYWMTRYFFNPLTALLANRIVTTSRLLAKDISFGKRAVYIPNGVHLKSFKGSLNKSAKYTVGYAGTFGDWVDFELLLHSARKNPSIDFLLVGGSTQFEKMKRITKDMNNVKLTGMVPLDKAKQYMSSMDVCTIPFRVNHLTDRVSPIKLFEYWALKKPVISTSFYEVLMTGKGVVAFADTAEEFDKTIKKLRDPKLRKSMAEKGFKEVQKYDWAKFGDKYRKIIRGIYRK